ncbi:MAG TPA: hypothetical protein VK195_15635, partial [Burkholderiaceae bacterium]|nr:hypothetical protein [Burkholderiaceae bacterium]
QRDQAHCQTLTGDPRLQRRQLLEVAARQGVDGAGMTLYLAGVAEPWVTQQVLREAERGHEMALDALASGELPQATRLQRDAAAEALLRSAEQPSANPVAARRLRDRLASIARQRVKEAWLADPGNPARIAAAKAVYQGEPVPPLQATADPQVRSLADRYLDTLRKRQAAKDF